jgi:cytochrome oxidase Cu insertion factor (SCO1/SenC/PrrC family)
MKAKILLAVSMFALLVLMAYLHFQPGNGNTGNDITAEDFSAGAEHAAPDFILNDISGRPVALNEYKGKVVLLGFWTTW